MRVGSDQSLTLLVQSSSFLAGNWIPWRSLQAGCEDNISPPLLLYRKLTLSSELLPHLEVASNHPETLLDLSSWIYLITSSLTWSLFDDAGYNFEDFYRA